MAKYSIKTSSGKFVGPYEGTRARHAYGKALARFNTLPRAKRKQLGHLTLVYKRLSSDGKRFDNNVCDEQSIVKQIQRHADEWQKQFTPRPVIYDKPVSGGTGVVGDDYIDQDTPPVFYQQPHTIEVTKPFVAVVVAVVVIGIILYTVFVK